jgi:hypothetical protein
MSRQGTNKNACFSSSHVCCQNPVSNRSKSAKGKISNQGAFLDKAIVYAIPQRGKKRLL